MLLAPQAKRAHLAPVMLPAVQVPPSALRSGAAAVRAAASAERETASPWAAKPLRRGVATTASAAQMPGTLAPEIVASRHPAQTTWAAPLVLLKLAELP